MSNFLLAVRVINVHAVCNSYSLRLVWPGGAAVHVEEIVLFTPNAFGLIVFSCLQACTRLVKLYRKSMLTTGLLDNIHGFVDHATLSLLQITTECNG